MTRILPRVLLGAYLLGLAGVALWSETLDDGETASDLVREIIFWFWGHGFRWVGYTHVEFVANVMIFVPFGVLVTIVTRRLWLGLLVGPLVSAAIEVVQAVALPGRHATLSDVAANTIGCVAGALVAAIVLRSRRPRPVTEPPRR